jgi:hypothetical protein
MSYIDDIVKSTGEERATLKVVEKSDINRYGDADESVTEKKITGVFELLSDEREEVTEGNFDSGDLRAYIPAGFENIEEGNILVFQDKEYRIQDVQRYAVAGEGHIEVGASRK